MRKKAKGVEEKIIDFFKCKNILCDVDALEDLVIRISFLQGKREYYFRILNKFNGKKPDWALLDKELEIEYQNALTK